MNMDVWGTLGIEPTTDVAKIKKAYAVKLKRMNVGEDPDAFQRLRAAFESARQGFAAAAPRAKRLLPSKTVFSAAGQVAHDPVVEEKVVTLLKKAQFHEVVAVNTLQRYARESWLEGFVNREAFEYRIADALARQPKPPLKIIEQLSEMFGWRQRARDIRGGCSSAMISLVTQYELSRRLKSMENIQESGISAAAVRALISGTPVAQCRALLFRQRACNRVMKLMDELENDYGAALFKQIDARHWSSWRSRLSQVSLQDQHLLLGGLFAVLGYFYSVGMSPLMSSAVFCMSSIMFVLLVDTGLAMSRYGGGDLNLIIKKIWFAYFGNWSTIVYRSFWASLLVLSVVLNHWLTLELALLALVLFYLLLSKVMTWPRIFLVSMTALLSLFIMLISFRDMASAVWQTGFSEMVHAIGIIGLYQTLIIIYAGLSSTLKLFHNAAQ